MIRSYTHLTLALLITATGCSTPAVTPSKPIITSYQAPAVTPSKPDTPESVLHLREQLVGTWFGDQPTINGGRRQWIMQRFKNGTFRATFRIQDNVEGNINGTEVGIWNVNDMHLIAVTCGRESEDGIIEKASIADSYLWDIYQIISISDGNFHYKALGTGNEYYVKKVPDEFSFPNIAEPVSLPNTIGKDTQTI